VSVHSAFSVVTFIFTDALTNRANNEGRRLEVTGAEIERLKKGNLITTTHKHNWQIEVSSATRIKIKQCIRHVTAGFSQTLTQRDSSYKTAAATVCETA